MKLDVAYGSAVVLLASSPHLRSHNGLSPLADLHLITLTSARKRFSLKDSRWWWWWW